MPLDRMKNYVDTMSDDDILVLGIPDEQKDVISPPPKKHSHFWAMILFALMGIVSVISIGYFCVRFANNNNNNNGIKDNNIRDNYVLSDSNQIEGVKDVVLDKGGFSYVVSSDTVILDMPLHILKPLGGRIELRVGRLRTDDPSIILAAQAADYRADNGQIAGAFVCEGELLAKGNSKLGFCAIIGNEVTMGLSKETPLFERAVEQSGYFFRHYALVHGGDLGELTPKGQAVRRALCYDGESLFIAESIARESYLDFSQALIQLGVQEAIALVGSIEISLYKDEYGYRHISNVEHKENATETYIVWVKDL